MADVNTPIDAYHTMRECWHLPEALMAGTKGMRAAGQTYLPLEGQYVVDSEGNQSWGGETEDSYLRRLLRTVLYNGYRKAVNDLRGKVFAQGLIVDAEVSDRMREWMDDIDRQGRDMTAFGFDVFGTGVAYGMCHILVDYSTMSEAATLADARVAGARPWLVMIRPQDLIGWRYERIGGAQTLTQVRIRERIEEANGEFDVKTVEQVRLITRNEIIVYREDSGGHGDWMVFEGPVRNTLGRVPLVTFYTGRTGFMTAEPPLMDLAEKNLEHWQSTSDQRTILHTARVPILFGSGMDHKDDAVQIGANKMFRSSDPQARLEFVEHSGKAIGAGAEDIKTIEEKMAALAMQPVLQNTGEMTATARALDQSEADSTLQSWALNFKDSLEQALWLMSQWAGAEEQPRIKVNTEFAPMFSDTDAQTLLSMRAMNELSQISLWNELQRRNILSEDFDSELERERLGSEGTRPAPGEGELIAA